MRVRAREQLADLNGRYFYFISYDGDEKHKLELSPGASAYRSAGREVELSLMPFSVVLLYLQQGVEVKGKSAVFRYFSYVAKI